MTETKQFTLSPQTQEVVAQLPSSIKLFFFTSQPSPEDEELLTRYRNANPKFDFTFVDPELDLGLANKFEVEQDGEVHLEFGDQRQLITRLRPPQLLEEQQITQAMLDIQSDRPNVVYFLQGHGEASLEPVEGGLWQGVNALEEQSYSVESLSLGTVGRIPEDATVVAIVGPQQRFLAGEIKALEEYQAGGGSVLLMLEPEPQTGLEEILTPWQLTLDRRFVVSDTKNKQVFGFGPRDLLIENYGSHPITEGFNNDYAFFQNVGSLSFEAQEDSAIAAFPLVTTGNDSWAEANAQEEPTLNPAEQDQPGPLTLGYALTKEPNQRMVVFSDGDFAKNGLFEQQINNQLFIKSIGWLSKKNDNLLDITPKESRSRRINLTGGTPWLIRGLALLFFPSFGLGLAIYFWWQRR
ncbi:MAG: GldG family protein [Synechococcaceae cyanobacterium RL_1_2]|nr:GldG family protein [Synechococcaceae cyanobacterium RL_1_2]